LKILRYGNFGIFKQLNQRRLISLKSRCNFSVSSGLQTCWSGLLEDLGGIAKVTCSRSAGTFDNPATAKKNLL
jgi:hypothetical protein